MNPRRFALLLIMGCAASVYMPSLSAAPGNLAGMINRAYVDTTYLAKGTSRDTDKRRFTAEGEAELSAAYQDVKFGVDLNVTNAPVGRDDGIIEQAYFDAPLVHQLAFLGGIIENPLGLEKEDAPDRDQISHGQIWNLMDDQTHLPGNSVEGVAFHGELGQTGFFAGFLNDLGNVANRHSLEVVLTSRPVPGLDLEGGLVSQSHLDDNPDSAETLFDLNAGWRRGNAAVAVEYFSGDKLIDAAYGVYGRYRLGSFLVAARWDTVRYLITGVSDTTTATLTAAYLMNKSLKLAVEYQRNYNNNTLPVVLPLPNDGGAVRLQALITL